MQGYFQSDLTRHEAIRGALRTKYRFTDLDVDAVHKLAVKICARASQSIEDGRIYLSPENKEDLDALYDQGYSCVIVLDDPEVRLQYRPDGWMSMAAEGQRTRRFMRLQGTLTQVG